MGTIATRLDVKVDQGSYTPLLFGPLLDATGATIALPSGTTARLQVRKRPTSSAALLDLTTANGGIVIDSTANTLAIYFHASATLPLEAGKWTYELQVTLAVDGEPRSYYRGELQLVPGGIR